jgi:hypothetical protein
LFLPGEDPLVCELWNYAMRFTKLTGDGRIMYQGVADEVVVVVKLAACEDMVTYLRIKLPERNKDVKGEGRNMKSSNRRT